LDGVKLDQRDDTLAALTMNQVANIVDEIDDTEQMEIDEADKQHLVATCDEFSRFIGQNNSQMLDFLTSTWDGEGFEYRTTTKKIDINSPLLNLIGCTTPVSLAGSMPPAAAGQGFLSRMILVYGAKKYKEIPRPKPPELVFVNQVKETLDHAFCMLNGEFDETPDARAYSESLYGWTLEITDSRFGYYAERRYTHLIKLSMCLAAGRRSHTIVRDDYEEAHRILRATERGMSDALGEFGMNPLAALKQQVLEFMRNTLMMPVEDLRSHFHRDARSNEFTEVLNDLIASKQLSLQQMTSGKPCVTAKVQIGSTEDEMMKFLCEA
jgi:hypothetical protein